MGYYAVAKGYCPGIYRFWYDCKLQVSGFPGSDYRKTFCYNDAWRFLFRQGIPISYDCGDCGGHEDDSDYFYYAIAIGKNPGIYHMSWHDCKDEVLRFSGAQYRKYYCLHDARSFMRRRCPTEYSEYEADEDSYEETDEDTYEETDEDSYEETDEDSYEETDEDSYEETNEDSYEETDEDSYEETDEDSYEETDEDSYEETDEDSYEETDEDSYEETDEDSSEETDEDSYEETDEDSYYE